MMVVTEKQAEIAILRTLGMSKKRILSIFIIQGSLIGITGTIIGLIIGIPLTQQITAIMHTIENFFQLQFFCR